MRYCASEIFRDCFYWHKIHTQIVRNLILWLSVVVKPKGGFTFRGAVGVCLSQAPYIAPELFICRNSEIREIV